MRVWSDQDISKWRKKEVIQQRVIRIIAERSTFTHLDGINGITSQEGTAPSHCCRRQVRLDLSQRRQEGVQGAPGHDTTSAQRMIGMFTVVFVVSLGWPMNGRNKTARLSFQIMAPDWIHQYAKEKTEKQKRRKEKNSHFD
jgi:hypothetical protein